MIITQAWNPVWANAENTLITLSVNFAELPENEVKFTASADDSEAHGVELYNNAINGEYGEIGEYVAPSAPPTPIPAEISTRQFLIAAALNEMITQEEALSAATSGTVPAAIQAVFDQLPGDQAFVALVTWAKMTTIPRVDPLVAAVAAAFNMTSQELDQFYIQAGAL